MISRAFSGGLHRLLPQARRLLFLFWLASLIPAFLATRPAAKLLDGFFGRSLAIEEILESSGLPFELESDLKREDRAGVAAARHALPWLLGLGALLSLFLSGGAIAVLGGPRYEPQVFWGACGRHFLPFVRLLLWSLLLLLVATVVAAIPAGLWFATGGKDLLQTTTFWYGIVTLVLAVLGLLVWRTSLDYARARIVLGGERKTRSALWSSLRLIRRNAVATLGFPLLLGLLGVLVFYVMTKVRGSVPATTTAMVAVLFVVQQLTILFRLFFRLTRYAGTVELLEALEPPTESLESAPLIPDESSEVEPALPDVESEAPDIAVATAAAEGEELETEEPPVDEVDEEVDSALRRLEPTPPDDGLNDTLAVGASAKEVKAPEKPARTELDDEIDAAIRRLSPSKKKD